MAPFLFDATELECLWCSTKQSQQKLCTKAYRFRVPCINSIFLLIWIFLSTSFEKHLSEPFESSNDLRVVLTNYVPRYERIISEKATKSQRVCFQRAVMYESTTEGFLLCYQQSYVLRKVIEKIRIMQNRTVFVNSLLFFERRGANVTSFLWKWSQLRKRLRTYALAPFFSFFSQHAIGWTVNRHIWSF